MKPLLIVMLLIVAGTLMENPVNAQATKLPDDVRRALPGSPSVEVQPAAPPVPVPSKLAAESESADELLKQALLRYQNIAQQSDGLTEQFLKELNERIARLESKLGPTNAPSPKQLVEEKSAATSQPSVHPQTRVTLRPTLPQATPATNAKLLDTPEGDLTEVEDGPVGVPALPKPEPLTSHPAVNVTATANAELRDIANALDAAADNYVRVAEQFHQYANRLRKQVSVNQAGPHK